MTATACKPAFMRQVLLITLLSFLLTLYTFTGLHDANERERHRIVRPLPT